MKYLFGALTLLLSYGTVSSQVQIGADINGETGWDESGSALDLSSDGSRVAIGAEWNDGNGPVSGHVRVFELTSGNWVQLGADIDGDTADCWAGCSLAF